MNELLEYTQLAPPLPSLSPPSSAFPRPSPPPFTLALPCRYMNYMEGVAEALPRVLYVHGSGQEVISLDSIAD